ncbi:MAG: MnmC family methyltransferase [Pseudobdellovibrionaceae bacterium]
MSSNGLESNYKLVNTDDESPSLQWKEFEIMHHSGGAYSETQYIYGDLIRLCFASLSEKKSLSFLSLGLGLGYNELLIVCEALKNRYAGDLRILSYESDSGLKTNFLQWLGGESVVFKEAYDKMFSFFARDYGILAEQARANLLKISRSGNWELAGALAANSIVAFPAEAILYDAFSSKTSPELWTEEFLDSFFARSTGPQSFIGTYACTGVLKRSLTKAGFQFEKRPGFSGKRNCSRATRL